MKKYSGVLLSLCLLAFFLHPLLRAQSGAANGSVTGTVLDPDGRVVAGAKVTLRHTDFGTVRTVASDEEGNFSAPALAAGTYAVQVEAAGFKPAKLPRVAVAVGSGVRLTVKLSVAGASQQVTVTGRAPNVEGNTVAPVVNQQEPATGNFLAGLTVTYLPNRDRDFSQFGQLATGVSATANGSAMIVAGQKAESVGAQIDGASFNDPLLGGVRGAHDTALFFPQTVVREFQLLHAGAGADVGDTNAGLLNIVTKEGSNKFHGEGFYIGRPAALTASDAFGHSLSNTQNEFGGSFGGPLVKNKAYYYFGFEQDFLHLPYWTQFAPQAPGVTLPAALQALEQENVEKADPSAFFFRTDVILTQRNTLNLALNFNRLHATNLSSGSTRVLTTADNLTSLRGNSSWLRGSLNTLVSSRTVNQALISWSRDDRTTTPDSDASELFINGFGVLGGNSLFPQDYTSNLLQLADDVTVSHGGMTLRFGGQFGYAPASLTQQPYRNGRFDFSSFGDYLDGAPRRFRQTFVTGNDAYDAAIRRLGLYVTARFSLSSRLTATAGLRWDGQWNPQPPSAGVAGDSAIASDLQQWQPRLGLAWNPRAHTVVRLSSGLYDAPTAGTVFQRIFAGNGSSTVVADSYFDPLVLAQASDGGWHTLSGPPAGLTVPQALVYGIQPGFRNPRSFQAAASLEQPLTPKLNLQAGYVRNSTWNVATRADANLLPPQFIVNGYPVFPLERPLPGVGRVLEYRSRAHSTYDGLLLTATWQGPRRTQVTANYTLARSRDNAIPLTPLGEEAALNPFNLRNDHADSSFDQRHNFNLSAVVNLPYGFKVNPVLIARSGQPYTPIIGFDSQNDANDFNDRLLVSGGDVAQRNTLRQPAFANLDIRFVKDITLRGEGHHLDLFLDVFNVTGAQNRNFGADGISFYGTRLAPLFSAGQPLFAPAASQFGGARQVQFTARIVAF